MSGQQRAQVERDRLQHHIVAALAQQEDSRLAFKGGTMLRVCALPYYRYSEDLDFDWEGQTEFYVKAMVDALDVAAESSGAEIGLSPGRGGSTLLIQWTSKGYSDTMKVDATLVPRHEVPLQHLPILPNHPDVPEAPPILCYELVSVMADKLSCLSRRRAPRDYYDLWSMIEAGVDIHQGWAIYAEHADNPDRQYGWRPHPADIRATYRQWALEIEKEWQYLVWQGQLPSVSFDDAFRVVDDAIWMALAVWKESFPDGELDRQRREHNQRRQR